MNKGLGVLIFVAGVAVGAAVTWKLTQSRVEKLAREEIDSVKAVYSSRESAKTTVSAEKPDIMTFYSGKSDDSEKNNEIISENGYGKKKDVPNVSTRVISPEEFGENEEYEQISVSLRSDGVLVYDNSDEIVTDPESLFGEGFLEQIGKFEDDCLHLVNDERAAYYEILREE